MNKTTMSLVDDFLVAKAAPGGHRRVNSFTFSPSIRMESIRRSFSYSKLPEEPLKLTVLKLDGSCFEIEIIRSATIAELRRAVEAVFSHIPQEGPDRIFWPCVWGHFCLCYDGQKLVTETDCISNYGINDGDQLQFVRHVSTNYKLKQPTRQVGSPRQQNNSLRSNGYEEIQQNDEEHDYYNDIHNRRHQHNSESDDHIVKRRSCSSSGCAFFLATIRRIMQLCSGNHHSGRVLER